MDRLLLKLLGLALPLALAMSALAGAAAAQSAVADCQAGAACIVEGPVRLSRRHGIHAARIDTTSGCVAVALTRSQRTLLRDRRPARISGIAYAYYATPGANYYRARDRWSGTGGCGSGTMLYATEVQRIG